MTQSITTTCDLDEFRLLLKEVILETVRTEISDLLSPTTPQKQFLTRQETAILLSISLPTLHEYTKRGIVNAYRLGTKIRYKASEVEVALTSINSGRANYGS